MVQFLIVLLAIPGALLGACRKPSGTWLMAAMWVLLIASKMLDVN